MGGEVNAADNTIKKTKKHILPVERIISLRNESAVTFSMEHEISVVAVESHFNMHIWWVTIGYEMPMAFGIRLMYVKGQT